METYFQLTIRDALNTAIDEEMQRDERVFVMGEEVELLLFFKTFESSSFLYSMNFL